MFVVHVVLQLGHVLGLDEYTPLDVVDTGGVRYEDVAEKTGVVVERYQSPEVHVNTGRGAAHKDTQAGADFKFRDLPRAASRIEWPTRMRESRHIVPNQTVYPRARYMFLQGHASRRRAKTYNWRAQTICCLLDLAEPGPDLDWRFDAMATDLLDVGSWSTSRRGEEHV